MIKTNKDFIPQIAEEFNITEKEITNILEFYFKDVKSKAEKMVDTDIYLYGLGTFQARRKKIYDLINYYKVRIERVSEKEMSPSIKERILEESQFKINQLSTLLEIYKDKDKRKKELKLEKNQATRDL